jgi:hypothetical protein
MHQATLSESMDCFTSCELNKPQTLPLIFWDTGQRMQPSAVSRQRKGAPQ